MLRRLFFAILLEAEAAAKAGELTRLLRVRHGLTAQPIGPERLHITLHWLQDHPVLPQRLLDAALLAGETVESSPFSVCFDRVGSMGESGRPVPLVLTSATPQVQLRKFQRTVAASMGRAGIGRYVRTTFKPHVTLLYDYRTVSTEAVTPVRWLVREFSLIESFVGESRYVERECWSLKSRQLSFDL